MNEFELIRHYFQRAPQSPASAYVALGIGDDCALLTPRSGYELAISTDMLVAGRHFFADVDPAALGWKALAVNLSDLAAMGAQPLAFTLALALPQVDAAWLQGFAHGLFDCADRYGATLIGGDTTSGPLNICITVFGELPAGGAIRRSGAKAGDDIWVSGYLGDAALGLRVRQGSVTLDAAGSTLAINALERPTPRLALGQHLRGIASAMLDISDGLGGDLVHLLKASATPETPLAAALFLPDLPLSMALAALPEAMRLACALSGGDDYELCFSAAPAQRAAVLNAARNAGVQVSCIGSIVRAGEGYGMSAASITPLDASGQPCALPAGVLLKGYDHFG